MHRDTVIGIVGVVILVAAMVGVFTYEKGQTAALASSGSFALANLTLPALTGQVALGETESQLVNVTTTNVTRVTFTVTWAASQAATNTVNVTVRPPAGIEAGGMAESDGGSVTLTIDVPNGQPTSGPLLLGSGEWKIDVAFVSSTGPAPGGLPVLADESVAYEVATEVTSWQASSA